MANEKRKWGFGAVAFLCLTFGVGGGFIGWEANNRVPTKTDQGYLVEVTKENSPLLSQIDFVVELGNIESIGWTAARGDYDQTDLKELTIMRARFEKHPHSFDCNPVIHERIEYLENAFHAIEPFPKSKKDTAVSGEDFKTNMELVLTALKNMCRS